MTSEWPFQSKLLYCSVVFLALIPPSSTKMKGMSPFWGLCTGGYRFPY